MSEQYVVITETVSISAVGTKLGYSEPVGSEAEGLELLEQVARGVFPDLHTPHRPGRTFRVSETEYVDRREGKALPKKQTRITLARVVATRD
ncbi:hypothetical protein [Pseudoclavibacter sp. RFBA6]|uniref:hypothetical protein n=1 Tax=Pseudoclavibacter sp. RFBA6 TaxID=2080573 RepID=UPI000CE91A9F|nr:hypothetical protein [Pseudoclavibacter sp. RFBA6]PPG38764.1 hypothetical protein C5C17_13850 [Pseudoclavibacter sp. RFBA6]